MIMVRYADDVVLGFEHEAEARRFLGAMKARLEKFSLALHPDKTRLIAFGRFAADQRARAGLGKPETFDFLGFTFISGKTRQGKFLVQRKTRRDRAKAKLREIKDALRRKMHLPIPEQGSWLGPTAIRNNSSRCNGTSAYDDFGRLAACCVFFPVDFPSI